MTLQPSHLPSVEFKGHIGAAQIKEMSGIGSVDRLSITGAGLLTVAMARAFATIASVRWLWLWRDVTRAAMRHVVAAKGLEVIDVLHIRDPGVQ